MLKGIDFIREKSRGKVEGGKELSSPAPVILGRDAQSVPKILWQRVVNKVNKFALLLQRSMFAQDSRDKPENDGYWRRWFSQVAREELSVASGNKVMDTRDWHSQQGVPPKYDVSGLLRRYTPRNDCASNGEVWHRPWCQKILGTGPSMTGARSANFFGRSMIEMLGVLAIIAVLTTGGIAGYSKAMEKLKLNKLLEEYSYLISGLLEHENSFTPLSSTSEAYKIADVVEGMNLVPGSWKKSGHFFIDSAQNEVVPFIRAHHFAFDVHMGKGKSVNNKYVTETFSYKMCTNLLRDLLQPLHGVVFRVGVYRDLVGGTYFLGDNYCSGDNCLVNASMTEIQNVCNTCRLNNDYCIFLMEFL